MSILNRVNIQLIFLFLSLPISFSTYALAITEAGDYDLRHDTEYLQVSDTKMDNSSVDNNSSLQDVSRVDNWHHSEKNDLNFGFTNTPYWFKTKLNVQQLELDWYLRILYPPLDKISVYLCQSEIVNNIENECQFQLAGDRIPFNERARSNPNHIIPISPNTGDNFLYIKLETTGAYQLPISMIDRQSLDDYLAINDFFRGAYLSLMLVMILYNLFIFLMTRSPTYVLYSGFVFTFLIFHMTYEGSGFQYLWPNQPELNKYALPITFSINLIFTILFVTSFLGIKKSNRYIYYYFRALLAFAFFTFLITPLVPYNYYVPLMNLLSLIIYGSAFYMGMKYWREGQSAARLFTIAWAVLTIGMITANLKTLGVIPSNFFTRYGYQVGSFLEVVLLSLALGERISRLQQEHMIAKQALLQEKQNRVTALKQLIIGISHEMNTPIGNISLSNSFLSELNQDLKDRLEKTSDINELTLQELIEYADQQGEAIETIATSKKTLAVLTHVFSNISVKKTDHPKAEFDLIHVIQDRILTYQDRIDFNLNLPKQCIIKSHPSAFVLVLNQAFDNIIDHVSNSKILNSMGDKDNLKVNPKVYIALKRVGEDLNLIISDNGNGLLKANFNTADLTQLFLPFYTKARGSQKKMGLGMYQMKNIITDLLKGKIIATLNKSGGLQLDISFSIQ